MRRSSRTDEMALSVVEDFAKSLLGAKYAGVWLLPDSVAIGCTQPLNDALVTLLGRLRADSGIPNLVLVSCRHSMTDLLGYSSIVADWAIAEGLSLVCFPNWSSNRVAVTTSSPHPSSISELAVPVPADALEMRLTPPDLYVAPA